MLVAALLPVFLAVVVLAACQSADRASGRDGLGPADAAQPPTSSDGAAARPAGGETAPLARLPAPPSGVLLSSGFERPVCGRYYLENGPDCEFGIQGDVETGPFAARTGPGALRIGRQGPEHMGVIADLGLPAGHAFIGVAHRVPAIPEGAIPADRFIQLQQMSPTDGTLPGFTVEVRLYPDRRLGLALFRAEEAVKTDWQVPVDAWFYVVVEVASGPEATQRMWVYDPQDRLVAEVAATLGSRQSTEHPRRTAQKVGGTRPTLAPMDTYADDWFISTAFRGPTRIGPDGNVLV